MLKSHERFHSTNGKRQLLVVDDEIINRLLLEDILKEDYELYFAENGQEGLELMRRYHDTLSLVLLDLMMPILSGRQVLEQMQMDPWIQKIPVIVLTSDQDAEVESLTLGASDFIQKPYPKTAVIMARIRRAIELAEDRQIINSTERDHLTGLYNKEYFYRYAEQYDHYHKETSMDAIILDVNHFHLINERYGRNYGDGVLKRIGEKAREMVQDTGGIVCRREADSFMIYCPHGSDYEAILKNASVGLGGENVSTSTRVRLRMGIYADVDKNLDIERRFDRAKLATDTIRNNYTKPIAIYDEELHREELFEEQLAEDFHDAITEGQFKVFYQPKFDIRSDPPVLTSAEALVRWKHPKLGIISPSVFVPLFEKNGMVRHLDQYVWREVASRIREWKDRYDTSVPVSVNVSRVDMFDECIVENFQGLLEEYDLDNSDYMLEITESAYTDDADMIIDVVRKLREIGFVIEMDDFGIGYSSLGMISRLPIDALKLDMSFVRNAFGESRDTRMLELIIGIAEYLKVPVIAEGVETEEQMLALKDMGCEIAQGFYFSRPLSLEEFENKYIKQAL